LPTTELPTPRRPFQQRSATPSPHPARLSPRLAQRFINRAGRTPLSPTPSGALFATLARKASRQSGTPDRGLRRPAQTPTAQRQRAHQSAHRSSTTPDAGGG